MGFLIALLTIAAIAALVADPPHREGRALAGTIARRIVCAPRLPDPCRRHPLALAYGFPVGKLARYLAPDPAAIPRPGGTLLVPVDFRRCRRPSCAVPSSRPGLTTSLRRVTAFTSIEDRRRSGGEVTVNYWHYRPGLGWEHLSRQGGPDQIEAASKLRLRVTDHPVLVPLETLPGRNHYDFPAAEEPPWRWQVSGVYPG